MAKETDKSKMFKMEQEIKSLQKHMAGLVRTILDLKSEVEALKKKDEDTKKDDMESLMERQKTVDKAIADNAAAIQKIDREILDLSETSKHRENKDPIESCKTPSVNRVQESVRKCRHYDRGHCKHRSGCRYFHGKNICTSYLGGEKCDRNFCGDRHPKVCKFWLKSKSGCKRGEECDFLHVTLAISDEAVTGQKELLEYKCVGCESCWTDKGFTVEYVVANQKVQFCLNCEDWIKDKSKVLDKNWSLFDQAGHLRYDV